MPIVSKYPQARQEQLLDEVLAAFANDKAPADLCLMTLGNAVSNVIEQCIPSAQRQAVAEQFARVLLQSVQSTTSS